jgi:hypothetical protein
LVCDGGFTNPAHCPTSNRRGRVHRVHLRPFISRAGEPVTDPAREDGVNPCAGVHHDRFRLRVCGAGGGGGVGALDALAERVLQVGDGFGGDDHDQRGDRV